MIFKKISWYAKFIFTLFYIKTLSLVKKAPSKTFKISVKLLDHCNFRCSTCGIWEKQEKNILSEDRIRALSKKYTKNLYFLTITGGEPFLYSERLVEAIDIFKKNCPDLYYVSINTNGYFSSEIRETLKRLLDRYKFLKLTIGLSYVPDAEWGARKNGVKGSFHKYQRTKEVLEELKKTYKNRIDFYVMLTISSPEDIDYIKEDKDLWINFVDHGHIYNKGPEVLTGFKKEDKLKAIDVFYRLNKKHIGYINKKFIKSKKKVFEKGRRPIKCYAGINRKFIESDGNEYICMRELRSRSDMNEKDCRECWTACEAVFDIVQKFPFIK